MHKIDSNPKPKWTLYFKDGLPVIGWRSVSMRYMDEEMIAAEGYVASPDMPIYSAKVRATGIDTNTRHTPRINWEREMESINETLDKAKERGNIPIWEVRNLLNYFADAGLIPEGNYIVSVSW